jgi:hypothetical protein
MKTCSKCGVRKKLDDFSFSRRYKDERQSHCKECSNKAGKKNYQENKDRYFNVAKDRTAELRRLLIEVKNHPCMDCKVKYPSMVMEFDHVRGIKTAGIAEMMRRKYAWSKILTEIQKCDLVCANCHRLRTIARLEAAGEETF